MEKVPCKNCNKMILPTTVKKTNGYCMPCFKEEEESKRQASRYEVKPEVFMEDIDRFFDHSDAWDTFSELGDFLSQFYMHIEYPESLPKIFGIIDLVCEFEAGCGSSGLWLYLNHYGANAESFKDALKTIRANGLLEMMDRVSAIFPDNVIPGDDNIRGAILESEHIERKIDAIDLECKKLQKHLLTKLMDYVFPRKQEILDEINSYGKIIKYAYDPDV